MQYDEEIELKKKIALYYHQLVSYFSKFSFLTIMFLALVSRMPLTVVRADAARELLETEQKAVHGAECKNPEVSDP